MDKLFGRQDVELLKKHLQALIDVEFFTIPLYLTGVYSFTNAALSQPLPPDPPVLLLSLYDVQQETLSVAVQEMLHLQLACNLANAFDVTPNMPKEKMMAGEDLVIPHLKQKGKKVTTRLGNMDAVINAMVDVERPDPDKGYPPPNKEVEYASIGDLYHAALELLSKYYDAYGQAEPADDPHLDPNHNQVNYPTFASRYPNIKPIATADDVINVANAITDQGEGDPVNRERDGVKRLGAHDYVAPRYRSTAGSRFFKFDDLTHFKRFKDIRNALEYWQPLMSAPLFYEPDQKQSGDFPSWASNLGLDYEKLQSASNIIWSYLIDTMTQGFKTGNLPPDTGDPAIPGFFDVMLSFKYTLTLIWQCGYCPSFRYTPFVNHKEAAREVLRAMDTVDPLCLYHWDETTAMIRATYPDKKNACQGLNQCKGLGWGGVATEKGNGACATADMHTCQGSNTGPAQGGCGFLSSVADSSTQGSKLLPAAQQWIPGANQCDTKGGCQTPISPKQVFDTSKSATQTINEQDWSKKDKERLVALQGGNVWDRARTLFSENEKITPLPNPIQPSNPDDSYDGLARRNAIAPTST